MSHWRQWLRRDSLLGEAATLLGGNVAAQAIAMLAYLVLTRLYTPDDFALFNIFFSYIEVLVILSTCKYELAVVAARDGDEAAAVARFAMRLNGAVALLLLGVVTLLYLSDSLPGHYSELGAVALLVPPMVWLMGSTRIHAGLYNRAHRYRTMASAEVSGAASGALLKIVFNLLGTGSTGLPLGAVLGQGVANGIYRLRRRTLGLPPTS